MNRESLRVWALVTIIAIALAIIFGWWAIRPNWLTQLHGDELGAAVQRFEAIHATVKGQSDPATIDQIAAGDYREFLLKARCGNCPTVQVATKIQVMVQEVLEYSLSTSKVKIRIEMGWYKVSPNTSQRIGTCHAQAFTSIYILTREDGIWKVSGGEESDRHAVDDSPDLLQKYCDIAD